MQKRIKLIATIGPASSSPLVIERMIRAGMDVARLNMSHGDHAAHKAFIRTIRAAERKCSKPVGILADLGGPKIRTGIISGGTPIDLRRGDTVVFAPEGAARGNEIPVTYAKLAKDVKAGQRILIDDGKISVEVTSVSQGRVTARVIDGGPLRDHKGINLPDAALSSGAMTKKDADDLCFAMDQGVNFIGVSFVQGPEDIIRARNAMRTCGFEVPIIAKIERRVACSHLDAILDEADATMVARGDLGVEAPLEDIPILQKRIITLGAKKRKPVIVATQMLESMIENLRPTRAEVTDVANAVFDGADAIMLSGETSVGLDPVNAIATMAKIAHAAEESRYVHRPTYLPDERDDSVALATARAACFAAEEVRAKAIGVFTMTGSSVKMVASQRPEMPIIAITASKHTARRTSLFWGVSPLMIHKWRSIDAMINNGIEVMKRAKIVRPKDAVVIVCGTTIVSGATNMMKVIRV